MHNVLIVRYKIPQEKVLDDSKIFSGDLSFIVQILNVIIGDNYKLQSLKGEYEFKFDRGLNIVFHPDNTIAVIDYEPMEISREKMFEIVKLIEAELKKIGYVVVT